MTSWREINERDAREGRMRGHFEVGFYKMAVSKGGPDVGGLIFFPCRIEMTPEYWNTLDRGELHEPLEMINGKRVRRGSIAEYAAVKINADEYQYLTALFAWAAQYDPDSPEAHPYRKESATPKSADQTVASAKQNIRDIPLESLRP